MDSNKQAFVTQKVKGMSSGGKDPVIDIALGIAHSPARQKRDIKFRLSRPNTQTK